jgi:hypothetical protein
MTPQPPQTSPFGGKFWILLFTPLIIPGLSGLVSFDNSLAFSAGLLLFWGNVVLMVACARACGVIVGRRYGGWAGVLTAFWLLLGYGGIALAGCATFMNSML